MRKGAAHVHGRLLGARPQLDRITNRALKGGVVQEQQPVLDRLQGLGAHNHQWQGGWEVSL